MNRLRQLILGAALLGMGTLIAGSYWAASKIAIWDSVKKMWPDPWFKITMIDLYTGFVAVGALIGYREKSVLKTSVWVTLLAGLGNIATFLYLVLALIQLPAGESFWSSKRERWRLF